MNDSRSSAVTLVPLAAEHFSGWKTHSIAEYAKDKQRTLGLAPEEALKLSRDSFNKDLPQGLETPDQYIFSVMSAEGTCVGSTWIGTTEQHGVRRAFVFDIEIAESERGKGYGRAAMLALEETVKGLGIETMSLHVFGFNNAAKSLYSSIGYEVTDLSMEKKL